MQLVEIFFQGRDDLLCMAFFTVCDGSKQILIFPGLVGVGSCSLMTMLEIQSVG